MRPEYPVILLVLLALAVVSAPTPAHAGGIVSICDEAHLLVALAGGGTVTFGCSGTITLTSEITIATDTTIDGSGQTITISGNNAVRVFQVADGAALALQDIAVINGNAFTGEGGGLRNAGTVEIVNSKFFNNHAAAGGAILNSGTMTITNSLVSENGTEGSYYTSNGGGIGNHIGRLTVINSLIADNAAEAYGGGIYNAPGATTEIKASTISTNHARSQNGGGIANYGTLSLTNATVSGNEGMGIGNILNNGGDLVISESTITLGSSTIGGNGIWNDSGTVSLADTIVAQNYGGNCVGPLSDGGSNIDSGTSCSFGPGNGSLSNTDPLLRPIEDNGGPIPTHALSAGSPAIDKADPAHCPTLDQRGASRRGSCDVGAYEYGGTLTVLFSTTNPALLATPVTFTATVVEGDLATPTGNVVFSVDGAVVDTRPLDANGTTSLVTSALSLGTHMITAAYAGDTNFASSVGRLRPDQMIVRRSWLPLVMR
jgi:hypothetical protein